MPKKHDWFPPHFGALSGICATLLGLAFTAWENSYFTKTLHINFPVLVLILIAFYITTTVIIVSHEYDEKQTLEDNYKALDDKYQSVKKRLEKAEEKLSSPVEIGKDGESVTVKASRKDLADPDFMKDVKLFIQNYEKLTESSKKELREKWIAEGKKQEDDYILTHKF